MNIKELKEAIKDLPDEMQIHAIKFESSACVDSVESARVSETCDGPALILKLEVW